MGAANGCQSLTKATPAANQASPLEQEQDSHAKKHARFGGFALGDLASNSRGTFEQLYTIEDSDLPLGEGRFSMVYRCVQKETQQAFAAKTIIRKWLCSTVQFEIEAKILRCVDHPNIVRLVETFEEPEKVYHIMELCTGGELLDLVIDSAPLSERLACHLFKQMLHTVAYLHDNHVMHRDLKAENWLFAEVGKPDQVPLKLCDFGAAKRLGPQDFATTKIGTPYYVAPEVLQGSYQHKADVWSLGILLHMFLGGAPPFAGANTEEVLTQVRTSKKVNVERFGSFVTDAAKQMLARTLERSVEKRPAAAELQQEPWLAARFAKGKGKGTQADDAAEKMPDGAMGNLQGFGMANEFEKATMAMIASQLGREAIAELEKSFIAMDTDGNGTLSLPELTKALQAAGIKLRPRELQELVTKVDTNGTGAIEYSEFCAIMMDQANLEREEVCRRAFAAFDLDNSGYIERTELAKLLRGKVAGQQLAGKAVSDAEISAICDDLDRDSDGRIDFEEFMAMLSRSRKRH